MSEPEQNEQPEAANTPETVSTMPELEIIEVTGSGFVVDSQGRGIPGVYANTRIHWQDGAVVKVEPLTPSSASSAESEASDQPEEQSTALESAPAEQAQAQE